MHKSSQRLLMVAAVIGVLFMGVAGWWVGGIGLSKPQPALADATPTPAPVETAAPAVTENPPPAAPTPIVVNNGILQLNGQNLQPGQFTLKSEDGKLTVITVNGPQPNVFRTGIDRTQIGPVVVNGTVTVTGGGKGATAVANVDAAGNITTLSITNTDGAPASGTRTLVISGQKLVVRPAPQAVEQTPPPVSPGQP